MISMGCVGGNSISAGSMTWLERFGELSVGKRMAMVTFSVRSGTSGDSNDSAKLLSANSPKTEPLVLLRVN